MNELNNIDELWSLLLLAWPFVITLGYLVFHKKISGKHKFIIFNIISCFLVMLGGLLAFQVIMYFLILSPVYSYMSGIVNLYVIIFIATITIFVPAIITSHFYVKKYS